MLPIELLITLGFVGMVAGLTAGLFGVGGGIVTVPALLFLTTATFRQAVAASLLVIALTTPVGLFTHHRAGNVRWHTGWLLALAGLCGIGAATLVDPYLSDVHLQLLFAVFLLYAAYRLAFGTLGSLPLPGKVRIVMTGLVAGFVAKLLGIGGGIVVVPSLVMAGADVHVAVATSLASVWTNALVATGINVATSGDRVWMEWAWPVSGGALVGIFLGSRLALKTAKATLQRVFGAGLVLVAAGLTWRALR